MVTKPPGHIVIEKIVEIASRSLSKSLLARSRTARRLFSVHSLEIVEKFFESFARSQTIEQGLYRDSRRVKAAACR